MDIRLSSTDNLSFWGFTHNLAEVGEGTLTKREQTTIASEIEKNKLVTAPHEYLSIDGVLYYLLSIPCVIRLLNSTCFYTLYAHTYLTLLIYIAGDFVHYTSVSDIVCR